MILFLHNRYRSTGGEERVVEDLMWLVRERLGEPAELLERSAAASGGARAADRRRMAADGGAGAADGGAGAADGGAGAADRGGSAAPGGTRAVDRRGSAAAGGAVTVGRWRAAAGLLRGGVDPREVGDAVRGGGARIVHAHNLHPTLGWRALAAARAAGAGVVLHLHQYRLVCAVGVCFTQGEECVRCHGANTLPGVLRNCRGSRAEALVYGAGLALWQRRLVEQVDAVIVPSVFARERLRELGAPLPWERVHVLAPPVRALARTGSPIGEAVGPAPPDLSAPAGGPPMRLRAPVDQVEVGPVPPDLGAPAGSPPMGLGALVDRVEPPPGGYALVVSRLAPEKGIDVAIEACRMADIPLVVAGGGLEEATRGARRAAEAASDRVRFVGRVDDERLAQLRAGATLALVPSRSAETFGLAAAEAMAAGVPVAGSRVGALVELLEEQGMAPPGDARALAVAIKRVRADAGAGERALRRIRALCAPEVVAERLAEIYGDATALHYARS